MTCIVGYIENSVVYIGADSAAVHEHNIWVRNDPKVFIKENMIFGYTSSFRMGQLLRFSLKIPFHSPEKSDYEYMCTDFIDAVVKLFKDKDWIVVEDSKVYGGMFIVGYRGNLYVVDCDFHVGIHTKNYHSCGCGKNFAFGALHALENYKLKPEKRITKALEAAAEFSTGVVGPFLVLELEENGKNGKKKEKKTFGFEKVDD